jgi:sporulation protein YlmC with PRC-barrel domain
MADSTRFTIGVDATCADGPCGKVIRVVVDPVAASVTHLVVEPEGRQGLGRLVPLDLVDGGESGIQLRCSQAEFETLASAEETQFLPASGLDADYAAGEVLAWPYYGLVDENIGVGNVTEPVTHDAVPVGEVTVRRGEQVHATDGDIGRVQGLVVNRPDGHVTHVLLQEGHLWGRKNVAIPIRAVTGITDGIHLNLSTRQVEDLPPVELDRPMA